MNRWIGAGAVAISLLVVFVWIPLDIETGLIEKVRRSVILGDAFAPTISGALIGFGGLLCLVSNNSAAPLGRNPEARESFASYAAKHHLVHIAVMLCLFVVCLTLMRYAGPIAVRYLHDGPIEYRLLRDTVPWKYIGFVVGGTGLVTGLIAWTERQLKLRHILIGLAATFVLIAAYDLPFDDLLLPPNGDV